MSGEYRRVLKESKDCDGLFGHVERMDDERVPVKQKTL